MFSFYNNFNPVFGRGAPCLPGVCIFPALPGAHFSPTTILHSPIGEISTRQTQYWFYWLLLLPSSDFDNFGWIWFAFWVRWKVPDKLWVGFLIPLFPALISEFIGVSCQVPGVHILPEVCGLHAFLDRWNVSVPDIIWIAFRRHNTPHSRPSSSNPPSSRLINRIKHDFVCRSTRLEQ